MGGNPPGELAGWRVEGKEKPQIAACEVESAMRGGPSHLVSHGSRLGTGPDVSLHVSPASPPPPLYRSTFVSASGAEVRGWVWDKGSPGQMKEGLVPPYSPNNLLQSLGHLTALILRFP